MLCRRTHLLRANHHGAVLITAQAPHVESEYQEARFALEDCEQDVSRAQSLLQRNPTQHKDLRVCVDTLVESVAQFNFAARSRSLRYSSAGRSHHDIKDEDLMTPQGLVSLNAKLMQAQVRIVAGEKRWQAHLDRAKFMEVMDVHDRDHHHRDL